METWRNFFPPEEHHSHKRTFHKEGHNAFYGQGRTKDIAYKPRIVAPIGAELKFQNDASGHAHGKINTEEFLPKVRHIFPKLLFRAIIAGLGNAHDNGKTKRKRHKEPMVHGRKGELRTRPVYRTC